VAWSRWAADSVASDYGVRDVPIEVAHPGAPDTFFSIRRSASSGERPTILFVGGDFERKGGPSLLRAFKHLGSRANLVLVTEADIAVPEGVRLIRGVAAGSDEHRRVFEEADLFCLPTLGDCTPLVIGEAMAAGLPIVTTRIGSNEESVGPDAGLLVPPADDDALTQALDQLVASPGRLREMGVAARTRASELMNADRNARRILAVLEDVAEQHK
jgi:glycosyltransferase involved in cell wall biosynthesis